DDDMPQMRMPAGWNTVRGGAGPLSQEGQQFEWQIPRAISNPDPPPVPQPTPPPVLQQNPLAQPPAQIVAGACRNRRNAARQEHPQFPDKIWCTKGRHWVLKTVFGNLLTCNACRATDHARAARLREQRAALAAAAAAELQLGAQIGGNAPQVNPAPPFDPL